MKQIPKSLHTITVIVRLARFCKGVTVFGDDLNRRAVAYAMDLLGYKDAPDPYGLAAAALAQLESGK
jgi:hypothetical protein